MRPAHALGIAALALAMQACAPLATDKIRASRSTLGCMRAAIAEHPLDLSDDRQAHCVAAGLIALRCSATEAWLASVGKEVSDIFGTGTAELRDLKADRDGIRCAHSATNDIDLLECCRAADDLR
jgi:hypothetical protein